MPIFYDIDTASRTLHTHYSGTIAAYDVLRFFDGFEPRLNQFSDYSEYVDFKRVTYVSMTALELDCLYSLIHGVYLRNSPRSEIFVHAPTPPAHAAAVGFADFFSRQKVAPNVAFV